MQIDPRKLKKSQEQERNMKKTISGHITFKFLKIDQIFYIYVYIYIFINVNMYLYINTCTCVYTHAQEEIV